MVPSITISAAPKRKSHSRRLALSGALTNTPGGTDFKGVIPGFSKETGGIQCPRASTSSVAKRNGSPEVSPTQKTVAVYLACTLAAPDISLSILSVTCRSPTLCFSSIRSRSAIAAFSRWLAASSSNAPALSLDRRFSSSASIFILRPEWISPYTPTAIARSAIMNSTASIVSWRYAHTIAASKIRANTTNQEKRRSFRTWYSSSVLNSLSLVSVIGFIFFKHYPHIPPPRRYRDRRFWVCAGLLVLYGLAVLYLIFVFNPSQG
jgi:hypothetical protein